MSNYTEARALSVSAAISQLDNGVDEIVRPDTDQTNSIKSARLTIIVAFLFTAIATFVIRFVYS